MKQRDPSRYSSNLAFLDILFNMVMAFAFLFLLSFLLIRPVAQAADTKRVRLAAELMIVMTWPDEAFDDLDLWLQLPDGRRVNYRSRDVEYVTLDRDDRGAFGDIITDPDTGDRRLIKMNKEMMTIRAIVPGHYVIAGHVYAKFDSAYDMRPSVELPYVAKMELTKINPSTREVASVTSTFNEMNEEKTFLSFDVLPSGEIANLAQHPNESIVTIDPLQSPQRPGK